MTNSNKEELNRIIINIIDYILEVHGNLFMGLPEWLEELADFKSRTEVEREADFAKIYSGLRNGLRNEYGETVCTHLMLKGAYFGMNKAA